MRVTLPLEDNPRIIIFFLQKKYLCKLYLAEELEVLFLDKKILVI